MKITDEQTSVEALEGFGAEATRLLCAGDFSALAEHYGYALAYDQDQASAIRADISSSLAELRASSVGLPPSTQPTVSYFNPNGSGLVALIEHLIPTDNERHILLELLVSSDSSYKYVVLEQVSAAA